MSSAVKRMAIRLVPSRVKPWLWCLTDSTYRHEFLSNRKRIGRLRRAQRRAWPVVAAETGGRVAAGPFAGLQYPTKGKEGGYTQKLLGTYEKELWEIVEAACGQAYDRVVDVGAAEGFYVCGMAYRLPSATVIGFEAQEACHGILRTIADLNGLGDRVEIRSFCAAADLDNALRAANRALVICDIEGAEVDVLDPVSVPALASADMLVEVHDNLRPETSETLTRRFSPTHEIQRFEVRQRSVEDYPLRGSIDDQTKLLAMDECRGGSLGWLWMKTKGQLPR